MKPRSKSKLSVSASTCSKSMVKSSASARLGMTLSFINIFLTASSTRRQGRSRINEDCHMIATNVHFAQVLPSFDNFFHFSPFHQAASVATLPSALLCERFSLGASWVFCAVRTRAISQIQPNGQLPLENYVNL